MTKIIFIFCVCLAAVSAKSTGTKNDGPLEQNIMGQAVKQGELPYHVYITYSNVTRCSGALVEVKNTQIILTSGECVQLGNLRGFNVTAGDLDKNDTSGFEQSRGITDILMHPEYSSYNLSGNMAIVYLQSPFDLNENVAPIDLPERRGETTGDVIVSGWGDTTGNESVPLNILQKIQLPIISNEECQRAYRGQVIEPSNFCTLTRGGEDFRLGYEGGPVKAVEGGYLAGLVSFVYPWAEGYPGVHTQVSHFVDWIEASVP